MSDIKLWMIDDGENHWIAAENSGQALAFLYESFGFDSIDDYLKEHEDPIITFADYTKPLRINITEEYYPKDLPSGCQTFVEIPVSLFDQLKPGLISSTVY